MLLLDHHRAPTNYAAVLRLQDVSVVAATREVCPLAIPRRPPAPLAPTCLELTSASRTRQAG